MTKSIKIRFGDPPPFELGDHVKIRLSGGMVGQIVELRGPLGPGGAQIYRVRIRRKPKSVYIEVRGDQLIPIREQQKLAGR